MSGYDLDPRHRQAFNDAGLTRDDLEEYPHHCDPDDRCVTCNLVARSSAEVERIMARERAWLEAQRARQEAS